MFEDIPLFWIFFVVAGIVAIGTSAARKAQGRAVRAQWAEAAEQLHLTFGATRNLFMSGSQEQFEVSVAMKSGDNETKTRYALEFPPLGLGLKVTPQTTWQGFLKAFGGQDVEVGDPTFDDRFVVKATSPDLARRYFTTQRIAALNTLYDQHPGFVLDNDELWVETKGTEKDANTIVTTMNDLLRTARQLQPDPSMVDPSPRGSAEPGDFEDLGETPFVTDREEELQRVFETIEEYAAEETEKHEPAPLMEEPVSAAPTVADDDALLVATRLFGEQRLGFEVERLFTEQFEGRSVEWTGTVKRPAGLMASAVFDAEDREVLVVEVASLADELYGSTSIDAIVAFPASGAPQQGETVRFAGTLVDVDGISKDLYVGDGRVV